MPVAHKPNYLSTLQVFRGVAAVGVVMYHAGLFTERQAHRVLLGGLYHFGELGVDFFFVLSGFIIAFVHDADLGRPELARRYVCRRFFRVYPLLFMLTTVKLVLELVVWQHSGGVLPPDASRILSSYLLVPAPSGYLPVVTVAWTLEHEVLFYGIFLTGILFGRRMLDWLLGGWMALVILFALAGLKLQGIPQVVFDVHNVAFVFGVVACRVFRHGEAMKVSLAGLGVAAAGAVVAGGWMYNSADGMNQPLGVRLLLGLGFSLLILVAALGEQRGSGKVWPKWALWVGDASYSIYLGHSLLLLMIIGAGSRFLPLTAGWNYATAAGACAVAMVACGLLWEWVERPLLDKSRRFCR